VKRNGVAALDHGITLENSLHPVNFSAITERQPQLLIVDC
jgi:hypothetical protein